VYFLIGYKVNKYVQKYKDFLLAIKNIPEK